MQSNALHAEEETPTDIAHEWVLTRNWNDTVVGELNDHFVSYPDEGSSDDDDESEDDSDVDDAVITLNGVQVDRNKYESIQRNASWINRSEERLLPKPVVIPFIVDGRPARGGLYTPP